MKIDEAIEHVKEVVQTKRTLLQSDELVQSSYNARFNRVKCEKCIKEHEQLAEWLEQLKEYQKLDEQGRLIKLPCKVGDKLYYIDSYYNTVVPVRLDEVITQFVGINNYAYQYNCCSFDGCGDVYEEYEFDNNDFGKTVFLTKSEAEVKLKELRGEEDATN